MFDVISSTDKVPNSTSEFFIYCSLAIDFTSKAFRAELTIHLA